MSLITVDTHEEKHHENVLSDEIDEYEVDELPAGDFVIEGARGKAIIERKEWTDFVGSYQSGTLFNQLNRCLEQEHDAYVIVEGSRGDAIEHTGVTNYQARRMFTSLHVKSEAEVIQTMSVRETAQVVSDFADWFGEDPSDRTHSVRPAEKVPAEDRPRYIVEGLPGIGPKGAERLLTYFGDPKTVLTATPAELQEVDGIGPKKAEKIVDAVEREHTK